MMLKVTEIIGYCLLQRCTRVEPPVAHTYRADMGGEQTVIRMLNGFSVVVNYSLHEEMEASMMVYEQGSAQVFLQ